MITSDHIFVKKHIVGVSLTLSAYPQLSHSSARALASHQRNVPDEVIRKVQDNNGVICIGTDLSK